ncbi:F/Y rich C-terminus-domain-containing protein [Mycena metata]|uniref:F/Y rich C-terminus-domain-containing protein n=1 Tax=Mycena metata TaxID=1033252 RepID=A0AAD7N0J8_9AGAR|nr:F/Y rich C-terminus-domain-containing protein [Mycena metata]
MPPPNFVPPPQHAPPQQQRPGPDAPRVAKPKRLKAHTVTSKSYSIPMVPRDKKGKPMLPLNVGIMTVINLGDVCMREHFHTERYIFPVGYEVTRRYLSTVDQTAEVVYHCTILDGGDGPKFQIIPSDVPDSPVIAGTATGAWSSIVKRANAIRQRQHSNSVSGPDFFGLGQNTIKHLIQELPNADRLRDYVWQHFVEGGPLGGRHAAVIPALPEEYDAHMLAGPYYPPRARVPTREEGEAPRQSHYPPHIIAQAQQQQQQAQASGSGAGKQRTPTPQQQQMPPGHDPHAHMSTGPSGGANYYLPHTHGQPDDTEPSAPGAPSGAPYLPEAGYPPPNGGGPSYAPANGGGPSYAPANGGGPTYAPATNGNGAGGNNSFASIMNAFPTQDDGGANGNGVPEGGPPS